MIDDMDSIMQYIIGILTLLTTIWIPYRIMWNQNYSSLMSDYRSYDFANAIQAIIDFFHDDCKNDYEKIITKYNEKVKSDKKLKSQEITLHNQRRLLCLFFWQLELCAKHGLSHRIKRDFTIAEANIIRILLLMNKAIDESKENGDKVLWKKIDCDYRIRKIQKYKGLNNYLARMYLLLQNCKKNMEVY